MSEFATRDDITRLEDKLEGIRRDIAQVLVLDERQLNQGVRLTTLEIGMVTMQKAVADSNTKLNAWINRGVGAWSVMLVGWVLIEAFSKSGLFALLTAR